MNLEDRQSEIDGLRRDVETVIDSLDEAESCETESDFNANMDEAIADTEALLRELRELRGAA